MHYVGIDLHRQYLHLLVMVYEDQVFRSRRVALEIIKWGMKLSYAAHSLRERANLYRDQGRYDDAENLYRQSLVIPSHSVNPWNE